MLFVVDESFLDFAGEISLLELLGLEPLPNVLVLKSLSKTLGVPGLRIGYVFAQDPMLLAAIDREIPIWNMSGPAEFFLELSLKFRPELAASFVRTAADRRDLVGRLRHSGAVKTVQEGHGNFVVVELHGTDDTATRVTAGLLERHRIHVKDLTGRFVHVTGPWLRLSVRLADEHERLVTALEEEHGHFGEP